MATVTVVGPFSLGPRLEIQIELVNGVDKSAFPLVLIGCVVGWRYVQRPRACSCEQRTPGVRQQREDRRRDGPATALFPRDLEVSEGAEVARRRPGNGRLSAACSL